MNKGISHGQWAYVAIPRTESGEFLMPCFVGRVSVGTMQVPTQQSAVTRSGQLRAKHTSGATRVILVPALDVGSYDYPFGDDEITEWRFEERVERVWVRQ